MRPWTICVVVCDRVLELRRGDFSTRDVWDRMLELPSGKLLPFVGPHLCDGMFLWKLLRAFWTIFGFGRMPCRHLFPGCILFMLRVCRWNLCACLLEFLHLVHRGILPITRSAASVRELPRGKHLWFRRSDGNNRVPFGQLLWFG